MLENTSYFEAQKSLIARYLSYFFCTTDIIFLPFLFIINLLYLGMAREVGEYIASFYINVIDLIILLISLKFVNYANNKGFIFISINIIWFIIEIMTLLLAIDFYFIEEPEVQYTAIESIYDFEMFAHDKAKAYLYLLGILILQILKIFLIGREIFFYFGKITKPKRNSPNLS